MELNIVKGNILSLKANLPKPIEVQGVWAEKLNFEISILERVGFQDLERYKVLEVEFKKSISSRNYMDGTVEYRDGLWIERSLLMYKIDGLLAYLEQQNPVSKESFLIGEESVLKLHPEIVSKCIQLFRDAHFAEAVEKGFKVVKDRLRNLTGFEKGGDAFGRGGLHIKGASAANVDEDFNMGVKFLTMAIDRFRNEKSHTSDAKIFDPIRAYEYLRLSSLTMHLLDDAEIFRNFQE